MQQLWYPGAVRLLGPAGRISGPPQPKHGAIYHSMVGRSRPADSTNSWQFGVFKDGHVEQYYPVTAWCWQAGDRDDPGSDITNNRDLFGIEHEGGPVGNYSEPLTPKQLTATIELTKWAVAEGHIHNLTRTGAHRGLWEHNEIRATACPSGRIPWSTIIARARKEIDQVTSDEFKAYTKKHADQHKVAGWLVIAAGYAVALGTVPKWLRDKITYLFGAS